MTTIRTPLQSAEAVERIRLCDLPTPPEVIQEAERWCRKYGWRGKQNRRELEARLKLQYYYGGQAIYVLRSADGPVVIPIAERYKNTPELRYVLLTPEERSHASFDVPEPWRDITSEVLS